MEEKDQIMHVWNALDYALSHYEDTMAGSNPDALTTQDAELMDTIFERIQVVRHHMNALKAEYGLDVLDR